MFYEFDKKIMNEPWSMTDMHCHKNYELYFLIEGDRTFFIENSLYKVSPLSFFFIPPFVMHKTEGQAFKRININFSSDFFSSTENEVFTNRLSRKNVVIEENNKKRITEILKKIEEISSSKTNESIVFTKCLTYELLYILCRQVDSFNDTRTTAPSVIRPIIITKIVNYIQDNLDSNLSLNRISQTFFISNSYLCKLFHKYMGISVTQAILNFRMSNACRLLSDSKKSINKIAEECGFSSANYFGLMFKKHMGLSPMNYRKLQNEKK